MEVCESASSIRNIISLWMKDEGHTIVEIRGSERRGLGLPLDSCYQYIPTNHLDRIRDRAQRAAETAMAEVAMAAAQPAAGTQVASN